VQHRARDSRREGQYGDDRVEGARQRGRALTLATTVMPMTMAGSVLRSRRRVSRRARARRIAIVGRANGVPGE
jgi:hypothetical protein